MKTQCEVIRFKSCFKKTCHGSVQICHPIGVISVVKRSSPFFGISSRFVYLVAKPMYYYYIHGCDSGSCDGSMKDTTSKNFVEESGVEVWTWTCALIHQHRQLKFVRIAFSGDKTS